jgi:hypothetical protein
LRDEKSDATWQVTKVKPAGPGTKRVALARGRTSESLKLNLEKKRAYQSREGVVNQ